jgi:hypothetical protein
LIFEKERVVPEKFGEYSSDLKVRYEAQSIAHSRAERKLNDLEHQFEEEREKRSGLKGELLQNLETEKQVRKIFLCVKLK